MNKSKIICFISALIFCVTGLARAENLKEQAAMDFLNRYNSIRIFVQHGASTGRAMAYPGNGHESASILIARRILGMGYRGKVELIYGYGIKHKMGMFIPGYEIDGPDRQVLGPQFMVTSLETFLRSSGRRRQVGLAITGASDYGSENLTQLLNAKVALKLNPKRWPEHNEIQVAESGAGEIRYLLNDLFHLGYALPQVDNDFSSQDISKILLESEFHAKTLGLQALMEVFKNAYFVPAYNVEKIERVGIIKHYLSVLRTIPQLSTRPIILGILSNMDDDVKAELASTLKKEFGVRVSVVEADEKGAQKQIKSVQPGRILIVHIGAVPQLVFEKYFEMASLPPLCAGKSTSNFLQYRGIPFLSTHLGEIEDLSFDHSGYQTFKNGSLAIRDYELREESKNILTEFVLQFLNLDSPLRQYFDLLRRDLISQDKLTEGLLAVKQLMDHPEEFARRKETVKIVGYREFIPDIYNPWSEQYKPDVNCRDELVSKTGN